MPRFPGRSLSMPVTTIQQSPGAPRQQAEPIAATATETATGLAASLWPAPGRAPGWRILRDCPLGGEGLPVRLALLHPAIGVVLIGRQAEGGPDPATRLRERLEVVRFHSV